MLPFPFQSGGFGQSILSGDPYFDSVGLLLHCDGTNGGTTFTDSSRSPKVLTANGNVQISTVQSKFGGASALFDASNDYISLASNSALNFGTGDFTIEAFVYKASNATNVQPIITSGTTTFVAGAIIFYLRGSDGGATARMVSLVRQGKPDITATHEVPLTTWTHIAISRQGTTVRIFIGGTLSVTATSSDAIDFSHTGTRIGASGWNSASECMNGYIDELRVTKGVARYTATFTPPTAPFPNN